MSVISIALFIGTAIEIFESVLELQFLEAGDRVFLDCLIVRKIPNLGK